MATDSAILDGIAAIAVGGCSLAGCPWSVAGTSPFLDNIYSLGGEATGVKELPDDIANGGFPAWVVMDGGLPSIGSGSYEVSKWEIEVSIWNGYLPRGERARELLNLRETAKAAFRAHARGGLVDAEVSSVLLESVGAIEGRQWRRSTTESQAPWYLVLPLPLTATLRRAVTYQPA